MIDNRATAQATVKAWLRAIEENEGPLDENGEMNLLAMIIEETLGEVSRQKERFAASDFETYWPKFVCDEDGEPDIDRIKLELHEYRCLWRRFRLVLQGLTGGEVSSPWVLAESIIQSAARHLAKEKDRETLA